MIGVTKTVVSCYQPSKSSGFSSNFCWEFSCHWNLGDTRLFLPLPLATPQRRGAKPSLTSHFECKITEGERAGQNMHSCQVCLNANGDQLPQCCSWLFSLLRMTFWLRNSDTRFENWTGTTFSTPTKLDDEYTVAAAVFTAFSWPMLDRCETATRSTWETFSANKRRQQAEMAIIHQCH
jgi:hypothetical protein